MPTIRVARLSNAQYKGVIVLQRIEFAQNELFAPIWIHKADVAALLIVARDLFWRKTNMV